MTVSAQSRHSRGSSLTTWYPIDAGIWIVAVAAAQLARFDFDLVRENFGAGFVLAAALAPAVMMVSGLVLGLYLLRYVPATLDEAAALATAVALTSGTLLVVDALIVPRPVPLGVPVLAGTFALVGMWVARFVVRAVARRQASQTGSRAIVFGAGAAGQQLVRQLVEDPNSVYQPVALLDDDPIKRNLRLSGVKIVGTRSAIAQAAERYEANTMIIAIPSAASDLIRDLKGRAEAAGLRVLILPALQHLMRRTAGAEDLREINVQDLLGRQPVSLDEVAIASQIQGKRILVTGAGGSIGSELCRQIHRFGPAELIMLDRDESALHGVQLSIEGRAMLDSKSIVLADIRDEVALRRIFADRRPEIVFHAAALKHLPLLEQYPLEAWKSNVLGTRNVLQAAAAANVDMFVNISTDKAAEPTSVLGFSKRMAERLTAAMALEASGTYVSVRFGNVLGSRGSVLTAFEKQIRSGGPLTVTHPEVTRYFMTISEACQLVLQSSCIGSDGEVMILAMGEPVKILDVAQTLIEQSGQPDIDIVFTGLREGEKMHEQLFAGNEGARVSSHPLVSHAPVPPLHLGGGEDPMILPNTHDDALGLMRQAALNVIGHGSRRISVPSQRVSVESHVN